MGKLAPQFAGRQQCDSQEFLQYFLGALHKELKHGVITSVDCMEKNAKSDKVKRGCVLLSIICYVLILCH